MGRSWRARGVGSLAVGGLVACSVVVDTRGLAGPPVEEPATSAEASAPDAPDAPDASAFPTGALALWSFEQTSPKILDVSGSGNDGTGYAIKQVHGKVGMGIELASEACVLVPDSTSLQLTDARALTMMAWTKITGCTEVGKDHGLILNKEDTYELGVQCNGTALTLQEAVMTEEDAGWDWHGSAAVTGGAWQHVAVTWDGTTLRHYVDGQEKDSHPQSGAILAASSGLGIGCRDVGADGSPAKARQWIAGTIDEVAIYGRALTDTELRTYYEATR